MRRELMHTDRSQFWWRKKTHPSLCLCKSDTGAERHRSAGPWSTLSSQERTRGGKDERAGEVGLPQRRGKALNTGSKTYSRCSGPVSSPIEGGPWETPGAHIPEEIPTPDVW